MNEIKLITERETHTYTYIFIFARTFASFPYAHACLTFFS